MLGLLKRKREPDRWTRLEVFLEFAIFGVIIGIVEDLAAIKIVTGEPITWSVVGIVILIAIPFAFLGEILVDKVDFKPLLKKLFGNGKSIK